MLDSPVKHGLQSMWVKHVGFSFVTSEPQRGEVPCSSSQSEHDSLEFNLRFLYALNSCIFSAYLLGAFEAIQAQ